MTEWTLPTDPITLQRHLRARLSKAEFFALAFSAGMLVMFTILHTSGYWTPWDYTFYNNTAVGDFDYFFYPYWWLPVFSLLDQLPFTAGYVLWGLVNIFAFWLGCRILGGKPLPAMLSYQMLYSIGYGQIAGLMVFGLALFWYAAAGKRWHLAGLALVIASPKVQSGFLFALVLWLLAEVNWKNKLKTLLVPFLITAVSLLLYPGWPQEILARSQTSTLVDLGSLSLWRWIGPYALLLWLPVLLLPMERSLRIIALWAVIPLSIPYFQQTDLLALYALSIPWPVVLIGNLGFLYFFYQWNVLQTLWIMPLALYLLVLYRAGTAYLKQKAAPEA